MHRSSRPCPAELVLPLRASACDSRSDLPFAPAALTFVILTLRAYRLVWLALRSVPS